MEEVEWEGAHCILRRIRRDARLGGELSACTVYAVLRLIHLAMEWGMRDQKETWKEGRSS